MKRIRNFLSAIALALRTHTSYLIPRHSSRRLVRLANIAEGTHDMTAGITYEADGAITERFLLVKRGSAANRLAICGAADTPLGVCTDEAAAAGDLINMQGFNTDHSIKLVASAAIAQDALVEPAASGRIATLGGGAGTHHVIGRAAQAATGAGDVIEVIPSYFLRVI